MSREQAPDEQDSLWYISLALDRIADAVEGHVATHDTAGPSGGTICSMPHVPGQRVPHWHTVVYEDPWAEPLPRTFVEITDLENRPKESGA